MRNIHSALALILFALLFLASATVQKLETTERTYVDTRKPSKNITVPYNLPIVTPTAKTIQMQIKNGVTISAEIVLFDVKRYEKQEKTITYADPDKPGYDIYEVSNSPYYKVTPEQIQFKIRIRNNEQVPLVLSQVGFSLGVDGVEFSFPTEYKEDWNKGLIMTGSEKEYNIKGPDLTGLHNAQVIRLFLNGVPTSYNEAGNITKKDNFEWFFECELKTVIKEEQRTYTYETSLIENAQCSKCSGTGTDPQAYQCPSCKGAKVTKNIFDGKMYTCSRCKGTGIVHYKCENCSGEGILYYPKSPRHQVAKSETWTGAKVQIVTTPAGAKISVVNTKTGEYESKGMSNITVDWYSSNSKSYPIIVEYQGQNIKVLPFDASGKSIFKIEIDFSSGTPIIKKGSKAN